MKGLKTIHFDYMIKYSHNGAWHEATTITVREPGLGKRDVWAAMKSYVAMAQPGILRNSIEMMEVARRAGVIPTPSDGDDTPAVDENAPEQEQDVLQWMGQALPSEKFSEFVGYAHRALTKSPKLATVGEEGHPITDEVWAVLDEQDGMASINRVLSEFTSFFFRAPAKSQPTNGVDSSPTLASPRPASLSTKPRRISPSAN